MRARHLSLPPNARLIASLADLDFLDSQTITLAEPMRPLEAWRQLMARPLPGLGLAFRLRDVVSARFGVARIGGFSRAKPGAVQVGDRLDFFKVEELTDSTLALTSRDRHLDVMACISTEGRRLTITGSVVTKNRFGRVYMVPVAPAHRLIVWLILRRLRATA